MKSDGGGGGGVTDAIDSRSGGGGGGKEKFFSGSPVLDTDEPANGNNMKWQVYICNCVYFII